jgi:hypothetical protein
MSVPKPVLTFVVGVTGHRSARLKKEHRARIAQQLGDVFANIEAECRAEFDRNKALYAEETPRLHLITSLADGTDAMAVQQCPAGWTTIGLLPCPAEIYAEILGKTAGPDRGKEAVAEFTAAREAVTRIVTLPKGRDGDSGFARACGLMLRQIDLLVAVWDREPGEEAGGTADVVAHALETGIPVVWIAADSIQKPWVIAHITDVAHETPMADATSGPIAEVIQRELAVGERHSLRPGVWARDESGVSAERRLREFFGERIPASHGWIAYDWITALPRVWHCRFRRKLNGAEDVKAKWQAFLDELPDGDGFKARIETVLLPRFAAADALASYYSHKYRSAYVMAYLLSVFAVASALASFVFMGVAHREGAPSPGEGVPALEIGLAGFELFFVGLIVLIVASGQVGRWHDRWLDYRALAEMLRHLRFLGLLGHYEKRAYLEAAARPSAGWVLWYFRATMRELGMPAGDLGPEYQRKVLRAVMAEELGRQIEYHEGNMHVLRRLHRGLHVSGDICFAAAFVILLLFLGACAASHDFPWIAPHLARIAPYVTACTALLPAFGAAFAGIRFTGDFEGFAERSAQTGSELEALRQRCDRVLDQLDFDTPANLLFESARIMAVDINGWTTLYSRKHLSLPG